MRLLKRKPPADLPPVDRTGQTCQRHGHQDISRGNPFGWCKCCEHTVHNGGRVIYYGEFYSKVPPPRRGCRAENSRVVGRLWSSRG